MVESGSSAFQVAADGAVSNLAVEGPRYCAQNSDMFPGYSTDDDNGDTLNWHPASQCVVKRYSHLEIAKCLTGRKIMAFGDSLSAGMFQEIHPYNPELVPTVKRKYNGKKNRYHGVWQAKGHERNITDADPAPEGMEWIWFTSYNDVRRTKLLNSTYHLRAVQEADVVFLNGGMWDMGRAFCSVTSFYEGTKSTIADVKANMKPGAQLIIFPMHWLHREHCHSFSKTKNPKKKKCYVCNNPEKVKIFREALQLAAASQGVGYLDTKNVSRINPNHTLDGIHFGQQYTRLEFDIFLNLICRDPVMLPTPPHAYSEQLEKELLFQWESDPNAQKGCGVSPAVSCRHDPSLWNFTRYPPEGSMALPFNPHSV